MAQPRSIRFDEDVERRLASFVARRPGLSRSAVAARLVDEGLRMAEHPGIVFRDGPAGRRASLIAGPDVWEVVRAIRGARANEPTLDETGVLALVSEVSGLDPAAVRTAVDYWAVYPDEVDEMVVHADGLEAELLRGAERKRDLLGR
jgi:hypothetical protein